jgi:hypothetical protein
MKEVVAISLSAVAIVRTNEHLPVINSPQIESDLSVCQLVAAPDIVVSCIGCTGTRPTVTVTVTTHATVPYVQPCPTYVPIAEKREPINSIPQ